MIASTAEIEFQQITKAFGSNVANRNVSFSIAHKTIHGVVGENGAGKSTIMKILYGLHLPDAGQILVRGNPVRVNSPEDAIRLGIGMVHQHFMLVPTLRVWQNVILGSEPQRLRLRTKEIRGQLQSLVEQYGFTVDLEAFIEELPVGHQQQVEILKLLYRRADTLILDEPTAVLTPQEVHTLFDRLRLLWKSGKTIILISHKLKEILSFTQAVTVMRRGEVIQTLPTQNLNEEKLAELIIGQKNPKLPGKKPHGHKNLVLEVKQLSFQEKQKRLQGLEFQVRAGEIVGIAGVEGNGQKELIEILSKVNPIYQGEVRFRGEDLRNHSTYYSKQHGLAVIPPDRQHEAVILDFSVLQNFILGHHLEERFTRNFWLARKKILPQIVPMLEQFDVRPPDPSLPIFALSGGNQQKVVLARELTHEVRLLIAAHPTRGVDIGATEFVHSHFLKLREQGTAILLISSELDEILALSDRILVLYEGKIVGEMDGESANETQLGLWMTRGNA